MPPLTTIQKGVVDYLGGDSAIIAAAGSGKTLVLVEKIATLVEKGFARPDKILVCTFTEKAAQELSERCEKRLGRKIFAGTIHAFAAGLLRKMGSPLGIQEDFSILDNHLAHLERVRHARKHFLELIEGRDTQALETVERFGFQKSVRLLIDLMEKKRASDAVPYPSVVTYLRTAYQASKRGKNFLDFNDLEELSLALLSCVDSKEVHSQLYDWIIVDEFQDTTPLQWEILSRLYVQGKNRLVIVGDPRQSIYRFRGADPSLFRRVCKILEKGGGKIFYLHENFRSSPAVIDFVNHVSHRLFPLDGPPMTAMRKGIQGSVLIHPLEKEETGVSWLRKREAEEVLSVLTRLKGDGVPWSDMCLLFRTRKAIPIYEGLLRARGIPYETSLGEPLLERPEILSVIFLLKKILQLEGSQISSKPQSGVEGVAPPALPVEGATRAPMMDAPLIEAALSHSPLAACSVGLATESVEDFLPKFFEEIGPYFVDPRHQQNLAAFHTLLEGLLTLGSADLKSLVVTLEALREEGALISCPPPANDGQDKVRLMTVHASKGLEFPTVFLCDTAGRPRASQALYLEDGQGGVVLRDLDEETVGLKDQWVKSEAFAVLEKKEKVEEIEESKRLLYVAMTRARDNLFFWTASVGQWQEWLRTPQGDTNE